MLNGNKTVAIDPEYHWLEIDKDTPRCVKLQLINKAAGVAVYGVYLDPYCTDPYFTHWAPLPTFRKHNETTT
jgi:hypothetical protein